MKVRHRKKPVKMQLGKTGGHSDDYKHINRMRGI